VHECRRDIRDKEVGMHYRYVKIALLASVTMALASVPGLAAQAGGQEPSATVRWMYGPQSPFGGTRFDGEYVAPSNRVYFLGFRTFADQTDGSVWYLNVSNRTYTDTGVDMPVPISNYGISALNDANGLGLYIFGGRNATGQIINTTQVYYPATNTAMTVASDPYPGMTPAGCIALPAMGVATINNRGVVMGGASFASSGCVDDNSRQTWIFNPMAPAGSRWTQGPNLNVARGYITPAVFGGTIYAIGGDVNQGGLLFAQPTVEAWQPPSGGWNDAGVADIPGTGCDESQAFAIESGSPTGIVLAGCGQWPNALPYTAFYNPTANTWSLAGQLNDNRRNHAGALVPIGSNLFMFVLGGYGEASGFIDPIQTSEAGRLTASRGVSGSWSSATGGSGKATTN
jgi:hypothetical protein